MNTPLYIHPSDLAKVPASGKPLQGKDLEHFVKRTAEEIAKNLGLEKVAKSRLKDIRGEK